MIVLYCKFRLVEKIQREDFLKKCFEWVNGMSYIPDSFKSIQVSNDELYEFSEGVTAVEYACDNETGMAAFRFKYADSSNELWTTDLVFNEQSHVFQLRLARDNRVISYDMDNRFRLPFFLRKLVKDGCGSNDKGIDITEKVNVVDENSIQMIASIINGKCEYELPIVFVTRAFDTAKTLVNADELAKDLAGIAHVFVEETPMVSKTLKELTERKNPYNGAVEVYYGGGKSNRFICDAGKTSNQFRWKISQSIYKRTALLNITEDESLAHIKTSILIKRLNNQIDIEKEEKRFRELELENQELKDKLKDNQVFIDTICAENDENERHIHSLELKNQYFESVINKNSNIDGKEIELKCTEKEFYQNEFRDILIECISYVCKQMGTDEKKWRHYHVLKDLALSNPTSDYRSNLRERMREILGNGKLTNKDFNELNEMGFEIKEGAHIKLIFHGDERYIVTVSCTPSDSRAGENTAHDADKLVLGKKY